MVVGRVGTVVALLILGCVPRINFAAEILDCEPRGVLEPVCGLLGSEDLEVLPGGHQLIVSESRVQVDSNGTMTWLPSRLALLDVATGQHRSLYPAKPDAARRGDWGDAECPRPIGEQISPHGIHLSRRGDGNWQLLVVNHGERESVEIFEVHGKGVDAALNWRGCVLAPPNAFLNDVAALANGGFVVTRYTDTRRTMNAQHAEAEGGANTGEVLRWTPGRRLQPIPGTETPMPNGIQTTRDGRTFFVAVKGVRGQVRKYEVSSGRLLGVADVPNPDNLAWSDDGRLMVAGLQPNADLTGCVGASGRPCGAAFAIHQVDPDTLKAWQVFAHEGPPLGLATVAVQAGDSLYVGSAIGDRVMRVPAAAWLSGPLDEGASPP